MVSSLDGQRLVQGTVTGAPSEAENIGIKLAVSLRNQGADQILAEIFTQIERNPSIIT